MGQRRVAVLGRLRAAHLRGRPQRPAGGPYAFGPLVGALAAGAAGHRPRGLARLPGRAREELAVAGVSGGSPQRRGPTPARGTFVAGRWIRRPGPRALAAPRDMGLRP